MPKDVSVNKQEEIENANAKVRCLDNYFATDEFDLAFNSVTNIPYMERVTGWEIQFIENVKDQIDHYKRPLTVRQFAILEKVWSKVKENYNEDLDSDAFRHAA